MRFETAPGEQAQVDWGSLSYIGAYGKKRRVWVFVMTMGWSRACYVELARQADTAAFIQCHVNAFQYLGGVPRRCLYDNAKVITLGRDEEKRPIWNQRMLDFARRVGFEGRLCQPYRAQTKGKVENGVKYVRRKHVAEHPLHHGIIWKRANLNRQGLEWCDVVANARVHGTTHRVPWEMLEGAPAPGQAARSGHAGAVLTGGPQSGAGRLRQLGGIPLRRPLAVGGRYGAGGGASGHGGDLVRRRAHRGASPGAAAGAELHTARPVGRTTQGGWGQPCKEAVAVQIPIGEVERRALDVYELAAGGVGMIALEQARQHLETLGLKQAVEVLDNTLDAAANRQLPYPEMLAELLGVEVAARRERYLTTRTRMAHLPFRRTLAIRLRLPALHR